MPCEERLTKTPGKRQKEAECMQPGNTGQPLLARQKQCFAPHDLILINYDLLYSSSNNRYCIDRPNHGSA
jgi:hypothetical protein